MYVRPVSPLGNRICKLMLLVFFFMLKSHPLQQCDYYIIWDSVTCNILHVLVHISTPRYLRNSAHMPCNEQCASMTGSSECLKYSMSSISWWLCLIISYWQIFYFVIEEGLFLEMFQKLALLNYYCTFTKDVQALTRAILASQGPQTLLRPQAFWQLGLKYHTIPHPDNEYL